MLRRRQSSAFTLVELLVSIAIALLLIVGVNTVFKATSQTVGAGNALLSANRDARTILQTMFADLSSVDPVPAVGSTVGDAPFFIIRSEHEYAYRNRADQASATNATDPSTDSNIYSNVALYPSNTPPVPFVHIRSHRLDRLGFFARSLFSRQTSPDPVDPSKPQARYTSSVTGSEAWVFYGHSMQPNLDMVTRKPNGHPAWCNPGDSNPAPSAKNDLNYVAADWMLSRAAVVLIPRTDPKNYVDGNSIPDGGGMHPFQASDLTSFYSDLAEMSIAVYNSPTRSNGISSYQWNPTTPGANYGTNWWDPPNKPAQSVINYRVQASPFIPSAAAPAGQQPPPKVTPGLLAQTAPDLIRGCSQFIVEYAGNFYTKNPDGTAKVNNPSDPPIPDPTGQLDFYVTTDANHTMTRHTRWYGYPRALTGATCTVANGDVVPLRDVLAVLNPNWAATGGMSIAPAPAGSGLYADAERFSTSFPPINSDYWKSSVMSPTADSNSSTHYTYTAAWGPDVHYQAFPKMVRIIVEIDDEEGRLSSPQRYEFTYDLLP